MILLAATTAVRGTIATALASQIIDASVDPCSYPMPYATSFVDPSTGPSARKREPSARTAGRVADHDRPRTCARTSAAVSHAPPADNGRSTGSLR